MLRGLICFVFQSVSRFGRFYSFSPVPGAGEVHKHRFILMCHGAVALPVQFIPGSESTRQWFSSRAVRGGRLCFPVSGRESTEDRVALSTAVPRQRQGKRRKSSHIAGWHDGPSPHTTYVAIGLEISNICLCPHSPTAWFSRSSYLLLRCPSSAQLNVPHHAQSLEPALEGLLRSNERGAPRHHYCLQGPTNQDTCSFS